MTTSNEMPVPGRRAHATLAPRRSAPRIARKLVRDTCTASGLSSAVVDDAAVIAGELVTTSIRQEHGPVEVAVIIAGADITVRICDHGRTPPAGSDDGAAAVRAWDLIRRLSSAWGYSAGQGERELWASVRHRPHPGPARTS